MYRSLIFICWLVSSAVILEAQNVSGKIFDAKGNALYGATVYCLEVKKGASTDKNGNFELKNISANANSLIISFVGFRTDTILINRQSYIEHRLAEAVVLEEIKLTAQKRGTFISSINPIKTEVISSVELTRAACCDLAGCFGTEASVQPSITNIVTNAKELRLLGLAGVYTQQLTDGYPLIQGLSYTYGISTIPGTLIDNIFIAKGSNSILQGFESISGQINVITKDPSNTDRLLLNAYYNSFHEKQINLQLSKKGTKWSSLWAFHTTQPGERVDGDDDQFMDIPLVRRYSFFNKWKNGNESEWGWHKTIGLRIVDEQRIGGLLEYDADVHKGTSVVYGQNIEFIQPEMYFKTGYRMDDIHHLLIMASGFHHDQNAYYGNTAYDAQQTNLYLNMQHEWNWKESQLLKTGLSYRLVDQEEVIGFERDNLSRSYDGLYQKNEHIFGIFAENRFSSKSGNLVWIAGLRLDNHNDFGLFFTPRSLLKIQAAENTTLRISAGLGWRTANISSENVNLLASSRNIIFTENLKPEKAINLGFNVIQNLSAENLDAYVSLDLYHTRFQNQIFPDYDTKPTVAYISNFEDNSVATSLKLELNFNFFRTFGTKLAYNYLDVYRNGGNEEYTLPFNFKHAFLSTFSYQPKNINWQFDANIHYLGKQKLIDTALNPEGFRLPNQSDPYGLVNAQFTKHWSTFSLYFGVENIFDFRQEKPILGWQDPFGSYFDTSSVWGPTRGREMYIGFRFKISKIAVD